jgi:hypothetical protein
MKPAPSMMVAATVAAALAGGVLLAAEDRMLFEPQHAMLSGLVDDVTDLSPLWEEQPARRDPLESRRGVTRAGSGVQERR